MYEEAFSDGLEGVSDINYVLPTVAARVFEESGYRLEDTDGSRLKTDHRHVFEAWFRRTGEDEDRPAMDVDLAAEFKVDAEKGTVTFTIEPLRARPNQQRAEEAQQAMLELSGSLTLAASPERRQAMRQLADDREREKETRAEDLKRFRAFMAVYDGKELGPEDLILHRDALAYVHLPHIEKGKWSLKKDGNIWRFVWWENDTIHDVLEFSDPEG